MPKTEYGYPPLTAKPDIARSRRENLLILDTNIFIDYLRGDSGAEMHLNQMKDSRFKLGCSFVTLIELYRETSHGEEELIAKLFRNYVSEVIVVSPKTY